MQTARRLLSIAAALVVAAAAPALAQLDPLGSEFQVNTFTPGHQSDADVATDAEGNFVAVWDGPATNALSPTVFVQRFDRDGVALGTEYEVPTGMCSLPRFNPAMCRNAAGGGVLAWSMLGPGETANRIVAQLFDSGGNLLGSEFQVSSQVPGDTFETYPSVACGDAGDFVVVWNDYAYPLGNGTPGILGRRFDSAGAPEGTEFQVNTYTSGYFRQPQVATDGARDFVVVWNAGPGIDGSGSGVFGQRFASNGDFLGTEFQINSYTMHDQQFPSVASDGAGDFVVAWSGSYKLDGDIDGVFAQRFGSNGDFLGTEFQVNTYTTSIQNEPSVASDAAGDFVIAWMGSNQDGSGRGVFAQRFDAAGSAAGTEFQVNTYTTYDQSRPSVAADDAGNFFVVWGSDEQDGDSDGVFGQRFDSNGNQVGSEFQVNTFTAGSQSRSNARPDADCNGSGDCGAAWQGPATTLPLDQTVFLQLYDDAGDPSSPEVEVPAGDCVAGPFRPAVCRSAAGDFAVAWERYPLPSASKPKLQPRDSAPPQLDDGDEGGVFVQRFDDAGNLVGSEFQVNTYTSLAQYDPDIACDDAGNFVVVWTSQEDQDGDSQGVFGQRFTSAGAFAGTEFQVNTSTTSGQRAASVAADANGAFIVAWQSFSQDSSGNGVFGQRFSSDGAAAGTEFQVNTYTTSDQIEPAVAMGAAGSFVVAWTGANDQDGDGSGVFAQRFSSDGDAAGTEFQVNEYTTADEAAPAVTAAADGDFVVAWHNGTRPFKNLGARKLAFAYDVFARQFDSGGTFLGTEFQVNSYTDGDQEYPALGIADDGQRLVAVWGASASALGSSRAQAGGASPRVGMVAFPGPGEDGSGSGVFGQLYGPTETPTQTPTATPTLTPTATPTVAPPGGPGGPPIGGGDEPGSNEVTGTGPPDLGPECLKVYEVGPNRVPDGGGPDDVLLGTGGTDANGNYAIGLNRPLKAGDVIFIVDTCAIPPASGPLDLITGAAPAPALSPALLAVALAMLSLIALTGTRRRQRGF